MIAMQMENVKINNVYVNKILVVVNAKLNNV